MVADMREGIFDFEKMERRSNVDSVEIIQVIRVYSLIGKGADDSPMRQLTEYWSMDGKLMFRVDQLEEGV